MKHLDQMTTKELFNSYIQYKLMELDDMAEQLGENDFDNAIPVELVRGNINDPEQWERIKRTGNNDLYPLSKCLYRNKATGEVVKGMFDEQSGRKLIGEIVG